MLYSVQSIELHRPESRSYGSMEWSWMWAGFSSRSLSLHPVTHLYVSSNLIGSGGAEDHTEDMPKKAVKIGLREWTLVHLGDLGPVAGVSVSSSLI